MNPDYAPSKKVPLFGSFKLLILVLALLCGQAMASQKTTNEVIALIEENFWKEIKVPELFSKSLAEVYQYLTILDPYAEIDRHERSAVPPAGLFGATLLVSPIGDRYALYPEPGGSMAQSGITQPVLLDQLSGQTVGAIRYQDLLKKLRTSKTLKLSYISPPFEGIEQATVRKIVTEDPPSSYKFDLDRGPVFQILRFSLGKTSYELREFMNQSSNDASCVTLDLRYSQGGDMAELASIVEIFAMKKGKIGSLNFRRDQRSEILRVRKTGSSNKCQLIILIGQYTASAAEFLAYSLKSLGGAVVVGERSYGKCSSQRKFKVSNGDLITFTNSWFEPAAERCDPRGLIPDIQMDVTFSTMTEIELNLISIALGNDN